MNVAFNISVSLFREEKKKKYIYIYIYIYGAHTCVYSSGPLEPNSGAAPEQ